MPPEGVPLIPHDEIISYEEIETAAKAAAELGITKIRPTMASPLCMALPYPCMLRIKSLPRGSLDSFFLIQEKR
jgi:cyclic pyranopterin phosphate synthase